jgi:hypothetical protein
MRSHFFTRATPLLLLLAAPTAGASFHSQGHPAERTRAAFAFECAGATLNLSFDERVRGDDETLAWPDRWRVTLTSFAAEGRSIGPADLRRLEDAFGRYAWLTRLRGRCSPRDGTVSIFVEGMLARDWAEFTESDDRPRPATRSMEISVGREGAVTIS